uniref:Cas1_AcylT domain-containing protein n=1 Tax=Mesocestoides corti TaxID=53468 RepID=A0A5K3EGW9_MESCO
MNISLPLNLKYGNKIKQIFVSLTWQQKLMANVWIISGLVWCLLVLWKLWKKPNDDDVGSKEKKLHQVSRGFFLLGVIVIYAGICNTGLGHAVFLRFTWVEFACLSAIFAFFGLASVRPAANPVPMNVELTNEIKGWMQAVIIIYHYLRGDREPAVYICVRIFVSVYLVLSGFGHFMYYWRKYSPKTVLECHSRKRLTETYCALLYRYAQVVLRMNFFTVILCLSLRQSYLLHYFVPLITYAYTLTTVTMTAWLALTQLIVVKTQTVGETPKVVAFVIVLSCATLFSAVLKLRPDLFDVFFYSRPFGSLLWRHDRHWDYRWRIDRYSTQFGLLCGFLFVRHQNAQDREKNPLSKAKILLISTICVGIFLVGPT